MVEPETMAVAGKYVPEPTGKKILNTYKLNFNGCLYKMCKLIDVIEFLLQSSFRNFIELYYN
jgi:hypothetical protein